MKICYSRVAFANEIIDDIVDNHVTARDGDIHGANDHSARWPARSRRVQVGSEKIQKMMMLLMFIMIGNMISLLSTRMDPQRTSQNFHLVQNIMSFNESQIRSVIGFFIAN